MHVIFVEPAFPQNQRQFARALHQVGAKVTGIGERAPEHLDNELKGWLDGYEQVRSVVDDDALYGAVQRVQAREWVDRLEATVEAHILSAARVREAAGIPGTSVQTAFLCRDKPAMKAALREAGIPCAQSTGASSSDEVREFAAGVGFPLILKPREGAGAASTHKVGNLAELETAVREYNLDSGGSVAVEEFVEGHEGFYDTVTINGEVAHEFITHYYPNVLEAMRTRWISPYFIATNRMHAPHYEEVKTMGRRIIGALGIGTSATHQEWFFGPKGLRFSEIGCRPPGVHCWDVYCAANEFDLYREWAMAIVRGRIDQYPTRGYSAALIALRPDRDGEIVGCEGVESVYSQFGDCIVNAHFPEPGTPTQPVEAGYMANAWMQVRHPDYDELRDILGTIGRTIQLRAR